MKVAIIGAGISGLVCAIALEKRGIVPDVFEQLGRPGEVTPFVQGILKVLVRPLADPLGDLESRYGIRIKPMHLIDRAVMCGPNAVGSAKGPLGYTFLRGTMENSLDNQLHGELSKTRVRFKTMVGYRELAKEYDWVVVATGSPFFAMDAGRWFKILRGFARGAVVEGSFDPSTMMFWFNQSYCNKGFAYMAPIDTESASLALEVSDVREDQVELMWRKFRATEKVEYKETQSFLREHSVGICFPRQLGNILFVGMAAGLLDYVTGSGLYNAIASGVLAAESIHEGSSYEYKIKDILRKSYCTYLLRLKINSLNNDDYDKIVKVLRFPLLNELIYNTNIDVIKIIGDYLKLKYEGPLRDQFLH